MKKIAKPNGNSVRHGKDQSVPIELLSMGRKGRRQVVTTRPPVLSLSYEEMLRSYNPDSLERRTRPNQWLGDEL